MMEYDAVQGSHLKAVWPVIKESEVIYKYTYIYIYIYIACICVYEYMKTFDEGNGGKEIDGHRCRKMPSYQIKDVKCRTELLQHK